MSVNWPTFFDEHNIDFKLSGPREALIECPLCADADNDKHLSVNLEGHGWKCWKRSRDHAGRSEAKLVQLLLGCSWEQASAIAGVPATLGNDFLSQVMGFVEPATTKPANHELTMPPEFKPFLNLPSSRPFIQYLERRGFRGRGLTFVINEFELRYCTTGDFKGRIIFPIKFDGILKTWTGRTIYPAESLRYRTLGAEEGALEPISHYLLNWDNLLKSSADTICLCEGPFDASKVQALGRKRGIVATCFFTATASKQQIDLLHELLPRFEYRYLLLDQGMLANSIQLVQELVTLGVKSIQLPKLRKDPGQLVSLDFLP